MEHSPMYEKIKYWYETELWTKDKVLAAVPKLITAEEYEEITGEPYPEPNEVKTDAE